MVQLELEKHKRWKLMMGMDLQGVEETIAAHEKKKKKPRLEGLDSEFRQLREKKGISEQERAADLKEPEQAPRYLEPSTTPDWETYAKQLCNENEIVKDEKEETK